MNRAETFRAIRALPKDRRRALTRAVRSGRAVEDPRDRALAAEWARTFVDAWWPRWLLPRERPQGQAKVLWLLHAVWLVATVISVAVGLAVSADGSWRWVVVALLVYVLAAVPPLLWFTLHVRWNAPAAERMNR